MCNLKETLFILILLTINITVLAKNRLVHYEPEVVTLTGFAKEVTCQVYDGIRGGEVPEIYGYLFLEQPIDIDLLPRSEYLSAGMDQTEKNIGIVQIVISGDSKYWKLLRAGSYIQVVGTLSSWVSGHHHARVLINVQKMKKIKVQGKQWAQVYQKANATNCSQLALSAMLW